MMLSKVLDYYTGGHIKWKWQEVLLAISVFILSYPFFVWGTKVVPFVCLLAIGLTVYHHRITSRNIGIIVVFLLLYIWAGIRGPFTLIGTISVIMISLVFTTDDTYLYKSFYIYKTLFSLTIIPSLLVFIAVIILGFDLPYSDILPMNSIKDGTYRCYPFLVVYEGVTGFPMLRFNGYYDEPGLVGTIAAVLLVSDGLNMKKIENWPLLIAGICSLSLFFYVFLLIYIFLFSSIKMKAYSFVVILGLIFFATTIDYLNDGFLTRFVFDEGKLAGDTRTSDVYDKWFENYITTPNSLIGLGGDNAFKLNPGGASYKDLIVTYGLIFFVAYITSFIKYFFVKTNQKRKAIICTFMFVCLIYQRPSITDFFYVFLFCGFATFIAKNIDNHKSV